MIRVQRKVRFNVKTDTSDQVAGDMRHRWTVAIVNDPREIRRIKQRMFAQLVNCAEEYKRYEAQIPRSGGLHCEIFEFNSVMGYFRDTDKVYQADIRKDRTLSDLPNKGLDNYVERLVSD